MDLVSRLAEHTIFRAEQETGVPMPDSFYRLFVDVFEQMEKELMFEIAENPDIKSMYEGLYGWELETKDQYQGNCWNNLLGDD